MSKQITLRIDETNYDKAAYIAKKDLRNMNNFIEVCIVKAIEEYESKNGEIQLDNN